MDEDHSINVVEKKARHQAITSVTTTGGMCDSPLNTLPAELRNYIWELVFDDLWETTTIGLLHVTTTRDHKESSIGYLPHSHSAKDAINAFMQMADHLGLLKSQLHSRLRTISKLICRHEDVMEVLADADWSGKQALEPSHALIDFLPQLGGPPPSQSRRHGDLQNGGIWTLFLQRY
ncbi:hypothetical protein LTR95_003068 [Oleoguttula sp. CCFEE 5521]